MKEEWRRKRVIGVLKKATGKEGRGRIKKPSFYPLNYGD